MMKKDVLFMKLNVKKFLSVICAVASVSGIVVPASVGACDSDSKTCSTFKKCSFPDFHSYVNTKLTYNIFKLLQKRDHYKFYDEIIRLKNSGLIGDFAAFILIIVDQTIDTMKHTVGLGDELSKKQWVLRYSEIENMIRSGNWDFGVDAIHNMNVNLSIYRLVDGSVNCLAYRAFRIFTGVINMRYLSLDKALIGLNPSNLKGLM